MPMNDFIPVERHDMDAPNPPQQKKGFASTFSFRFKRISTKFLVTFAIAMVIVVTGIYYFNTSSTRSFGYVKEIERARALTSFCEQIRTFVGDLNQKNTFATDRLKADLKEALAQGKKYYETDFYKTVPVVAAWTAARAKADELGYQFRVPKNSPRNPRNAPRPGLEQAVVNYLEGIGSLSLVEEAGGKIIYPKEIDSSQQYDEIGVLHKGIEKGNAAENGVEQQMNAVRFFRAIKLTQDCLACHGSPAGELDPLGFAKEGWSVGETHGAFEIIAPLDGLDAQIAKTGRIQFGISGAVLIISLIAIFLLLSFTVFKPLNLLKNRLQDIATGEGDLTKELDTDIDEEVAEVSEWFNRFLAQLRDLIREIANVAEQVAASSEELSSSSQMLASSSTEQVANLEETSTSIVSLTESVEQNSDSAQKTNEVTGNAANNAEKGGEAVEKTVEAMKAIAEKITVIDEIADQTNLLALNAAIEAARAGEMGKGFAVVAVEVRKLAERSQEAAKEISVLAKNSVGQAETAGKQIQEIVPVIKEASNLMNAIAEACSDQSSSAERIRHAISQIEQATQQNSATSEETASASEELSAQAQQLQQMVSRFTV